MPNGIYIVVTTRDVPITLQIDCEKRIIYIDENHKDNIADIRVYIEQAIRKQGVMRYIKQQGLSNELFIKHLINKSQGNFMYLRYVLPAIDKGDYRDLNLDKLPNGLVDYYEQHIQRMKEGNKDDWLNYKLPIIMALAVTKEPISIDLIADYSQVKDRNQIYSTLRDCRQFLHESFKEYKGKPKKIYRFYHASFHDFIDHKSKEDESFSRQNASEKFVDHWARWFEDE